MLIFHLDLVRFTRWAIALDPLRLTTLAGREAAGKTKHVRAVVLGSFQAQRAGISGAADALVPRPMLALALARAVPRYYFTLAARAMELGLLLAHRARLGAALLHCCFLLYRTNWRSMMRGRSVGRPRARVDGVQLLRVKGGPKGIGAHVQRSLRSAQAPGFAVLVSLSPLAAFFMRGAVLLRRGRLCSFGGLLI